MTKPEPLKIISIAEQAGLLSEPFAMIDLVHLDDQVLSIYLCQGTMPVHRHLDQDELFMVHSGTISLDSDWGTAILRPGELAVAPKGVGHRSSSLLRSVVLLLQPRLLINRRNGHRRLFAVKDERRLEKVSVPAMGRQIATAFNPVVLAHVDTCALTTFRCEGTGPWWNAGQHDALIFCFEGHLTIESASGTVALGRGELTAVPKSVHYRLTSVEQAQVLTVRRHQQPGTVKAV